MMVKTMKKSFGVAFLALVLMLVMATSAFANPYNSYNYYFQYGTSYHAHSSGYIIADATESGGNVTITLSGNYFPEVEVDGIGYSGVYNAGSDTTTITFPGSSAEDIDLLLHVVVAPWHNAWYPLTLIWG
jgi:hypothetical protein